MTQSKSSFALYNYFRSSASHRVRIALHLKNIEFEYRPVHLLSNGGEQHQADYIGLNPSHQVPTLVHTVNGQKNVIGQSLAILDYLDRCDTNSRSANASPKSVGEPSLFPEDPLLRAQCLQVCEVINSGMQPLFNLRVIQELGTRFGAGQEATNDWTKLWMARGLQSLESLLAPLSGEHCFKNQVTAADCFLIPQLYSCDRFQMSLEAYPTLVRIRENCERLSAFQKASPFAQVDTPAELRTKETSP